MLLVSVAELVNVDQGVISGYLTFSVRHHNMGHVVVPTISYRTRCLVYPFTAHGLRLLVGPSRCGERTETCFIMSTIEYSVL